MMRAWYERLKRIGALSDERLIQYDVVFFGIAIVALWYLFHPYTGIIHDSSIYIGRALADLHPSSIGQQLSYAHDGQSRFSLAPKLFEILVGHFGPSAAAVFLTVFGLGLWIAAATFLLSRLLPTRLVFAALLCLCAMPSAYGGNWVFHWAEPFATPRIFSEAASLLAMGMLVNRHFVTVCVCLVIAVLLHPIMALPAIALVFAFVCQADWRWLWLGVVGVVALVVGDMAGIELVRRLFVFPDPTWLAIIGDESKQVLLSDWYASSWSLMACQFVTVGFACYFGTPKTKRVAMAVLIVAATCVLISLGRPPLLILQAQTWRALWLLSFFAVAFLPLVASELWKSGRVGQGVVALLLAGWLVYDRPIWAPLALIAAVGLAVVKVGRPIPRWILCVCWGFTFAAVYFVIATTGIFALSWYSLLRDGIYNFSPDFVGFGFQYPLLLGLAMALAFGSSLNFGTWTRSVIWLGVLVLAAIAFTHWDRRSKFAQALDEGIGARALAAQMPSGDVFWLGGYTGNLANADSDGWLWTRRPSWWDGKQGAGVVFDRRLAIESDRRKQLLRRAGLLNPEGITRKAFMAKAPPIVTHSVLNLLCDRDGPDWIVAPSKQTDATARIYAAGTWQAPAPTYLWDLPDKRLISFESYLIFNCRNSRAQLAGTERPTQNGAYSQSRLN